MMSVTMIMIRIMMMMMTMKEKRIKDKNNDDNGYKYFCWDMDNKPVLQSELHTHILVWKDYKH